MTVRESIPLDDFRTIATATAVRSDRPPATREALRIVALYLAATVALGAVVGMSSAWFGHVHSRQAFGATGIPWLDGWMHWDAGWYAEIARHGYSYVAGTQSTVAFFPLYPMAMRAGAPLLGGPLDAGVVITWTCSLVSLLLFDRWLESRVSSRARRLAIVGLLVFPYSYFLYGAVYSDALFLACALGSFVLLERRRPWLGGVVGALGAAARPIGIFLVVALVLRAFELRGGAPDAPHRPRPAGAAPDRRASVSVVAAAVSVVGFAAYCAYLWARFGDPWAFVRAQEAWGHTSSLATVFKLPLVDELRHARWPIGVVRYVAAPVITVVALGLVPRVFRRFGRAYGVYTLLVVGFPAAVTNDFFSMGRFLLAAFPCFALAGELVASRGRKTGWAIGAASAASCVVIVSLLARGYYLA